MIIEDKLLTINQYSRPGSKRKTTTKIAVHYTGNPGSTAIANRNYFDNLRYTKGRYVSSNYIVGLDGEVIRCVPDDEIAYCTNQANEYSISIETCHPKADGIFTDKTYVSLVELCAYLLKKYSLTADDLIRHYDVTQKQCPLAWSPTMYQSETAANAKWETFKMDVRICMSGGKITRNNTVDTGVTSIQGLPYKVRISSPDGLLNVRKAPGTNNAVVCTVKNGEVYTIAQESTVGATPWGKLKSGAGWINVSSSYVKKC